MRPRRLARKYRTTVSEPPKVAEADGNATTAKIRTATAQLRETARGDQETLAVCSEIERLLNAGWVERRGPDSKASKPRPMPPEWKGCKEPPEIS